MESAKRNQIDNCQSFEISRYERSFFDDYRREYPRPERRLGAGPTARYNCHGLTFASRRTRISDNATLQMILRDDGYSEVSATEVQPGDVIIYVSDESGDMQHSGIVLTAPDTLLGIPIVLSKWGNYAEVIHAANDCPYHDPPCYYKYFRVKND